MVELVRDGAVDVCANVVLREPQRQRADVDAHQRTGRFVLRNEYRRAPVAEVRELDRDAVGARRGPHVIHG